MKVVFFEDVEGTALVGDVKDVKNGFARNFLLPRGLAGPATPDNLQRARARAEREVRRQAKLDSAAQVQKERLEGYTVTIEARVGETGRLYGSVTNRDIAARIEASTGLAIDPHAVLLPEPIRELGHRPVTIKFTRNVSVDVDVDVVPDEESKPIVAKLEAERAAQEDAEAKARAQADAAARAAGEVAKTEEKEPGEASD